MIRERQRQEEIVIGSVDRHKLICRKCERHWGDHSHVYCIYNRHGISITDSDKVLADFVNEDDWIAITNINLVRQKFKEIMND